MPSCFGTGSLVWGSALGNRSLIVIPAQAGIQRVHIEGTPPSAGVTRSTSGTLTQHRPQTHQDAICGLSGEVGIDLFLLDLFAEDLDVWVVEDAA